MALSQALLVLGLGLVGVAADGTKDPKESMVVMHKLVGIECGQVRLSADHMGWAQELAGLQEGSCESIGYAESHGTREVSVPMLGNLGLGIFRKPDLLGIAKQVGQQLRGGPAARGAACCTSCRPGEDKYVAQTPTECREACLDLAKKLVLSFSGVLDSTFELAHGRGCLDRRFPVLNATLMKGVEPASLSWDVYTAQTPGSVILRKVAAGVCGELVLPEEKAQEPWVNLIGLENGTCVSAGYVERSGQQSIPGVDQKVALFRKADDIDLVEGLHLVFAALTQDTVTMFKVVGDLCSEAAIDRKFQAPLQTVGQFSAGSCKEHGYSMAAGSQSFSIPLITDVQLALYHKGVPGMNFLV
mmetsp:Transcript_57389/g.134360  ORF Transcript_57389/g.134360 Transcript_57389/m.134360 type:complete len:358 (+) Transcript_57389:19-1092(+)